MVQHSKVYVALRACLAIAFVTLSAACGSASSVKGVTTGKATVSVPGSDRFAPFSTVITAGTLVTFHNGDADEHTVVSVPGDPMAWRLALQPGQSVTIAVDRAGTHRYYCSIHAHYDPATGQVAANANADHPDEPMEGVVTVSAAT